MVVTRDASQDVIEFLKREEAEVVVEGNSYSEALDRAKAAVAANPDAYVSQMSTWIVKARPGVEFRGSYCNL